MKKNIPTYGGDATVQYEETDDIKQKVFDRLIEFFKKHESWSGESICQSDNPQIEAPELLSDIADNIIKFKLTWN